MWTRLQNSDPTILQLPLEDGMCQYSLTSISDRETEALVLTTPKTLIGQGWSSVPWASKRAKYCLFIIKQITNNKKMTQYINKQSNEYNCMQTLLITITHIPLLQMYLIVAHISPCRDLNWTLVNEMSTTTTWYYAFALKYSLWQVLSMWFWTQFPQYDKAHLESNQ